MRNCVRVYFLMAMVSLIIVSSVAAEGNWTHFTGDGIAIPTNVMDMAIDHDGVLWVGNWYGLWSYDGAEWRTWWYAESSEWMVPYPGDDSLLSGAVSSIAIDADNVKWFTIAQGVISYDGHSWNYMQREVDFISIAVDQNNVKWFGSYNDGIWSFDGTEWKSFSVEVNNLEFGDIRGIAVDSCNNVWCTSGVPYDGEEVTCYIARFDGIAWENYSTGLRNASTPRSMAIDADDVIWIGIDGHWFENDTCVMKFDGSTWTTYSGGEELSNNRVYEVAIGPDNVKWFGTSEGGVARFDGTTWATIDSTNGLPDNHVLAIAVDRNNVKWFGTDTGVSRLEDIPLSTETLLHPMQRSIIGNYPNPFNPTTTIEFSLGTNAFVTLDIYSITGQKVATLVDDYRDAGMASGLYLYRFNAGPVNRTGKILMMK